MTKGEENWHELPRLYVKDFNYEGVAALAAGVIERAIKDYRVTEYHKMVNFFTIRLLSTKDDEKLINKDAKEFFLSHFYVYYAHLAGFEMPGKDVIMSIKKTAFKQAARHTKGTMPF